MIGWRDTHEGEQAKDAPIQLNHDSFKNRWTEGRTD
jgi:hypothetical protein